MGVFMLCNGQLPIVAFTQFKLTYDGASWNTPPLPFPFKENLQYLMESMEALVGDKMKFSLAIVPCSILFIPKKLIKV